MNELKRIDPEIYEAVVLEARRQEEKLELIASENYTSKAVLEAVGSVLTNKYAEGYPGKRYYGGCEYVDVAENLARDRAKKLFQCDFANVQPHSGSQANMAVYFSVLKPGDTILGMDLTHGGHLTHGAPISFSGKLYTIMRYGVSRETETIDYAELAQVAKQAKPQLIIAGASAYPRIIDFKRFREVADEVGALFMVDIAHIGGLIAAGMHPSPLPLADFTTGTTHKTLRGPRGGFILIGKDRENTLGVKNPKTGTLKLFSELVDASVMPGIQGGPLMHVIAGKAVAFKEALTPEFRQYQKAVVDNARVLCDTLKNSGARIVSGGTDNHLMLVDVTPFGVTGKDAEAMLDEANITANKNVIPFDTNNPFVTSGVRFGTPAVTSRGMGVKEMELIGSYIIDALKSKGNSNVLAGIRGKVKELCKQFPIF